MNQSTGTGRMRNLWNRYARQAQSEIREWNKANPELREQNPPRFKHKPTDDVRPL